MNSTKTDKLERTSDLTFFASPSVASNSKSSVAEVPKSKEEKPKKKWYIKLMLLWLTLGAVIIGVTAGLLLRNANFSKDSIRLLAFPGVIFMNMLQLMVLPLIITSIITGLAQISGKNMARLIGTAFSLIALTTLISVFTGIAIVTIIHPGHPSYSNNSVTGGQHNFTSRDVHMTDTVMDMIRNLFPPNLFEAFLKQAQTTYVEKKTYNEATNTTDIFKVHKIEYRDGPNIIGIITLCMAVGICLSKLGKEKNRVVVEFLTILDEVIVKLIILIMWYSPIGIISFIIEKILQVEDLWSVLAMLSKFIAVVTAGLIFHAFITLPLIYFVLTRKNPVKVFIGMSPACLIAFAASSSSVAMPTTLTCTEENLKVPKMISRFVIPVGSTINMNGTALFEAVAAIFIAQLAGMELSLGDLLTLSVTATLAGVATACVPHAGLVTLIMVLASIGLPPNDIQLIFTVDWILLRLRVAVNVLGDGFVADIVSHFMEKKERKLLKQGVENNELENQSGSVSLELAEP